jgi:hypothetical protein
MIATVILLSACFSPALAQRTIPLGQVASQADCQFNFRAADRNGNGVLSKGEIYAAKRAIPAALTAMHSVSKGQFMLECEGQLPGAG